MSKGEQQMACSGPASTGVEGAQGSQQMGRDRASGGSLLASLLPCTQGKGGPPSHPEGSYWSPHPYSVLGPPTAAVPA